MEVNLRVGSHEEPLDEDGNFVGCVNEYISWITGGEFNDQPECVSPVLRAYTIALNDTFDDALRQRLRPYAVRMIGTAGDGQDERRAWMALDWLIRAHLPAFLELAGLGGHAEEIRSLPEQRSDARLEQSEEARDAAGDAANGALWEATQKAGSHPARVATRTAKAASEAADAAAREATGFLDPWGLALAAWETRLNADAAAWAAMIRSGDSLRLTIEHLQRDSLRLLDELIDPAGLHDVSRVSRELLTGRVEAEMRFQAAKARRGFPRSGAPNVGPKVKLAKTKTLVAAMASRVERAEHILTVQLSVANGMRPIKVRRHADGTHTYIVRAGSKLQQVYTVEAATFRCTCPDAVNRNTACKHGIAAYVLESVR